MNTYTKPHLRPIDLDGFKEVTPMFHSESGELIGFGYKTEGIGQIHTCYVTAMSNQWAFKRLLRKYFPAVWNRRYGQHYSQS